MSAPAANEISIYTITFHYMDGQAESFEIHAARRPSTPQDVAQLVRHLLDRPYWTFQMADQTVFVRMANVTRVEVMPPLPQLQGEGVFVNAARVTALVRGSRR
jgi:hypothetical protein